VETAHYSLTEFKVSCKEGWGYKSLETTLEGLVHRSTATESNSMLVLQEIKSLFSHLLLSPLSLQRTHYVPVGLGEPQLRQVHLSHSQTREGLAKVFPSFFFSNIASPLLCYMNTLPFSWHSNVSPKSPLLMLMWPYSVSDTLQGISIELWHFCC